MRSVWMFLAVAIVPTVMAGEPGPQLKFLGPLEGGRPKVLSNVVFSPDGKLLASSDYNIDDGVHAIKLWDVAKRKVVATLPGGMSSAAFSPDGKTLAAGGREKGDDMNVTLKLWDVATGKAKASLNAGDVNSVAFSPDGKTLASAGMNAGKTGTTGGREDDLGVKLWDLSTLKEKASLKGHVGPVFSVAFSPDGKLVASGSGAFASNGQAGGGEVKVWDAATGRELALMGGVKLAGKLLSYLREEASRRKLGVPEAVWQKLGALKNKEFRTRDDFERELGKILGKSLDKDKREEYLNLMLNEGLVHEEGLSVVMSVAFSPDSKTLASAHVYGNVVLWDVQSGKRTATLQKPQFDKGGTTINATYAVAFSPDGKTLAAATVQGIKLWDVKTGKSVGGPNRPLATVWSVAFSNDGKTVASAGNLKVIGMRDRSDDDPTLRLWEWIPAKKADR